MMISVAQSVGWLVGDTEVLGENIPRAILSATNLTGPEQGSYPGRRGEEPAIYVHH
jgi:hypothetical protein